MASRFADINSVEQFIEDQENETKERKLNRMWRNRVYLKSLNVLRPQFIKLVATMLTFTGAVIHGGQFNISISSLIQSPTLAAPETEIKSTKRYK